MPITLRNHGFPENVSQFLQQKGGSVHSVYKF